MSGDPDPVEELLANLGPRQLAELAVEEQARTRMWQDRYEAAEKRFVAEHERNESLAEALGDSQRKANAYRTELKKLHQQHPRKEDAERVFLHWQQRCRPGRRMVFGEARSRKVYARLNNGYSVEELCEAIDGAALPPEEGGAWVNDAGKRYDDLTTLMRDEAIVDRLREAWQRVGRRAAA